MVAVDTNVLLRSLVRDDVHLAERADKMLLGAGQASLLLDRLILAECTYVLRSYYEFDKADIADWLAAIMGDSRFSVPDREMVQATVALFGSEKPLSFEDCWLLALRHSEAVKAVATLDEKLAKRVEKKTASHVS